MLMHRHNVRPTFHGYAAATRMRPEWRVQFLVFKAGVNETRPNSITGGGQIYGHEFLGTFEPFIVPNASGIGSIVGGGQIPGLPPSLQALFGGAQGSVG